MNGVAGLIWRTEPENLFFSILPVEGAGSGVDQSRVCYFMEIIARH